MGNNERYDWQLALSKAYGLHPFHKVMMLGDEKLARSMSEHSGVELGSMDSGEWPCKWDYVWWQLHGDEGLGEMIAFLNRLSKKMSLHGSLFLVKGDSTVDVVRLLKESGWWERELEEVWVEKGVMRLILPQIRNPLSRREFGIQRHELAREGKLHAKKLSSWDEALTKGRVFSDHYSMSETEQRTVFDYASELSREDVILELGIAYGKTAAILSYTTLFTGADYWAIDDYSLVGSPQEFMNTMRELRLPMQLLVGKTERLPWTQELSMLIVDAGHDAVSVQRDVEKYVPLIKSGGLVLFHDYDPEVSKGESHWGVRASADAFTGGWVDEIFCERLLVRRRP